jgi:putative copper resistance protein D
MRFSTIGHFVVALAIASGAINLYLVVGGLPLDWSFPYQVLLAIKIALVGVMTAQALVNRYLFVPRLSHHAPGALRALARGTKAEIGLGACVLLLVAWFGTLDPM